MDSFGRRGLLVSFMFLLIAASLADAWTGHVCSTTVACSRRVRRCPPGLWCRLAREADTCIEQRCCTGWTHNGNQDCSIRAGRHRRGAAEQGPALRRLGYGGRGRRAVCDPPCIDEEMCVSPGVCQI